MKRLFLLALLVLFTLPIFAKHVSVETAQQVARNFWEQNVVKSTDVIFSDVTSQTEFTNFYIFNTDGGFVIVSADDIAYPVLGYSDEGSFNTSNIAINTLEWLRGYQRQIQFGIDNNIKATEEISDLWYKLQNGIPPIHKSTRAVSALMTTKWNQGPPYNLLCPYDDRTDENAVTGCVATAMAQVMKYWNYPTRGTGSYSYLYSSSYYPEQSADFENTTYDWNNMPDRLLSYSSQAEKDAVSTLMYHCGVSVGMNYGTVTNGGGSAAHTVASGYEGERCTELALKDNFGYKTSLQGLGREDYTGDWDNLLKAELNARRPIIYSGNGTGGGAGHCFVCDGYNDNDYFHFNWGWGGAYDGFFLTTALTPGGGGIGSDDDNNYSYRQAAVIGIEPAGVTVSPEIIEAASAGGNYSATVKAGTAASSWTSTSSADWLTISPTTGAGSETTTQITVTATANTGSAPRTATVTFSHGSTSPTILTVVQPDSYTESCVTMHEDRFSSPSMYYITAEIGYLFGVNTYGTQAYAEVFEATGNTNYDLNSIVFMYGVDGEEGSVTFKVWADNDGVPGGELASETVTLSELYAAGNVYSSKKVGYYTWTLNPSIVVPNKFFAGVDVSNATSGFALYSTTNDDEEYTNNNYRLLGSNWSLYNTGLSMYVLPTICPTEAPFYLLAALPSSLSYIADGESKDITVNSNTNWTATSSADWLTLSPTSGSNNGTITAVAAANTSNGERTATITVSASGVNQQTISVTQADPSECFIAHEDRFTSSSTFLPTSGGYVCGSNSFGDQAKAELFELSNRYYNITSIDFMYCADGEEGSVTFKVWANNNGIPGDVLASKTVTLSELYSAGTVYGTSKQGIYTWTLTTPVTISGNFFAGIDVSSATSNIGLASTARGSGYLNSCYEFYNGRWSNMTPSWSNLDVSMYILPNLCPIASYVIVSPSSLSYSADGGSNDVTVSSNVNWTATSSENWLTMTPSSGSGNGSFSVVADANASNGERTATITVSGEGASSQTISVTQANPNACVVLHEERFTEIPVIRNVGESSGGGIVCGKNNYTQACAELFEITDRYYNLTSIDFMYAADGDEGSVTFKVWANNNGIPGDVLASKTVTLSTLYSAGTTMSGTRKQGLYTWTLTTPVTISGNFFAGIDVSNSTSYIGLFSTNRGSGYTNSNYKLNNGNWVTLTSFWNGFDCSMFVLPTACPIPSYNITVLANNDAYGEVAGGGTFSEGTQVTVSANPATGYNFVNWTENSSVVSTNANYTFTATAHRTLVANFEAITYTVTANANPAAGGSVTGAGSYTYGQTVTLNATANTGYSFINWTENGTEVSTNTQYSFDATANRTLVANFQINTYTISASASPVAGGTVNGAGYYTHGQNVTLSTTANTGYNFVNWTENGTAVSTNATYSFTATDNRTLVANFEAISYTITANANPTEGGSVSGAGSYTYGQTATLTATANTGYQFVNWTDGNAAVSDEATYSFTVNGNRTLVANFQINTYTITANANPAAGGTVNGAGNYTYGQTVTLNAIANTNYSFVNWTENGSIVSTAAEYSFTATENRTLVANFATITYTITASANPTEGGTITGAGDYTYGQNVTLNAVANTGYTFVNWTENGTIVSTDVEYSFTANDDRTLVANFEINTYTITASANPTEYGTVSGAGNYTHGQTVTLIATANTDYSFVNWTENGSIVSTDAEYSFTATASRTLVANFATITYTITASASPVAGGTVTGSGSYASGQEVNLSAIANTGYNFTNWTENGSVVSTNADYSFTAEADRILVANFTLNTYTISATANPTEGGTIEGADEYSHGESVILRATANTGYTFKNWTEGNAVVSTNAQYSFTATADRILVANFQINTYSINATANPTEGGTIEGADEYSHGETVTLRATANTGYTFTNWTEGNAVVSTDAQYSFTATADRTLVANFEINTYTITAIANPTEGGTIEGADEYSHGETVTLRATANTGYTFTNWTEGNAVVSTDAQYSFSATADRTLVANFEINTYTVTAVADPTEGGTVTIDIPSQNGVYNYGTNLVITATANEGYHFVQWNDGLTTAQRTYMVDANAEFIAYFVQNEATRYIIAATANPREGGTITGTGVYEADAQAVLTATANTGYTFTNWTENGTVVSTNAEYSFTVTTSRTLVANFELNTYTITASANPAEGGTMTGAGEYTHGQMVTLRATANAGYAFINWTENGSVVSNTASYMFEATADRSLVANFDAVTYTINASANPADGGTITGTGNYAYGQNITLTATANDGYIFANWTENGFVVSSDAEYSFTVTSDRTLVANFGATTYSVTASANPTEGGTIDGAGDYVPGQTVYLIATANEGYTFVNWTENGSVVYTNPSYQFTAISDRTLVANFEINTYTIIASANPFAGGTIEGDGNYTYGQTATLTATANTGYEFVNWTEDNEIVSTDTEYSFTVTTNRRLVAHFGIGTYTISANANPTEGGTVEGADEYTYGQTATLRATANENYNFTNWTEDNEVVSTDAEYSFTVTADRNLVANFIYNEPAVYTITAIANPTDGGTIEGAGVYREGESVSLSASARTGYHFVNWTENEAIVSTNAEYTFTARENRNLVANFQKDRYTVYITKNHLDGGTVEGDGEYEFGETATIIATANENYRFVNWTEAGEELSTEAEYSFEVTRDRYIVANFIYEMSVDAIELGSISVYPNPTSGMFKVEFGSITGDVTCQIVNASGSVIETRELNVTDGSEVVFDCNVAPGVYFVRVISNDRIWIEPIVINR